MLTIKPSQTSYWSQPAEHLDPTLFEGDRLKDSVRQALLTVVYRSAGREFSGAYNWLSVWLAGSGVSYQWEASRSPKDLDCLVGIAYIKFRLANPGLSGLSDSEIAAEVTDFYRHYVQPKTINWLGRYELTIYANPQADIRDIKPYAAYDVVNDTWTVHPSETEPQYNAEYDRQVASDLLTAQRVVQNYNVLSIGNLPDTSDEIVYDQADSLFGEIHGGRHASFSPGGEGYGGRGNYRWQGFKATGAYEAIQEIRTHYRREFALRDRSLYGESLKDTPEVLMNALVSRSRR